MSELIKPMFSASKFIPEKVVFPVYIQPKFDGFRCIVQNGVGLSRTLEPFPNPHLQEFFKYHADVLEGMDGEICVSGDEGKDEFRLTPTIMRGYGVPNFTFYVFDYPKYANLHFEQRFAYLITTLLGQGDPFVSSRVKLSRNILVRNMEELEEWESVFISEGLEGAIIRSPFGPYKQGRSTNNQGYSVKIKRFVDDEAQIIGFEELLSNQNEATQSNLGLTKRSSHQENKVPMNTLGAFIVKSKQGIEFKIGTGRGLTHALRKHIWENRLAYAGQWVKYSSQEVGGYDKPRCPVWLGMRQPIDMGGE